MSERESGWELECACEIDSERNRVKVSERDEEIVYEDEWERLREIERECVREREAKEEVWASEREREDERWHEYQHIVLFYFMEGPHQVEVTTMTANHKKSNSKFFIIFSAGGGDSHSRKLWWNTSLQLTWINKE